MTHWYHLSVATSATPMGTLALHVPAIELRLVISDLQRLVSNKLCQVNVMLTLSMLSLYWQRVLMFCAAIVQTAWRQKWSETQASSFWPYLFPLITRLWLQCRQLCALSSMRNTNKCKFEWRIYLDTARWPAPTATLSTSSLSAKPTMTVRKTPSLPSTGNGIVFLEQVHWQTRLPCRVISSSEENMALSWPVNGLLTTLHFRKWTITCRTWFFVRKMLLIW